MRASHGRVSPPARIRLRLVVILLALAFAGGLVVWAPGAIAVRERRAAARHALERGRLDEAARALDDWLRIRPEDAEAHYLEARLAWAREDLNGVQEHLAQAQRLGHAAAELAGLRGLLLYRAGRSAEAEASLRLAFDVLEKPDPEVADALARLYLGEFRMGRAGEVLERWRREWPDDARPHYLQTEIDRRAGVEPGVIIDRFRTTIRLDPSFHRARLGLADQLRLDHREAEAIAEYRTYLTQRPDDPLGHYGLGLSAMELGDESTAAGSLDRALELAPRDPVILGARATLELRANRPLRALSYLDRAVQLDPFDHSLRYQRMLTLSRLGRKAEADAEQVAMERIRAEQAEFAEIRRALERNPKDTESRRKAARWLMEHGHEEEAVDWANLVLRAEPSDPSMNRLLADYYRNKGDAGLANFHESHISASPE